jgi:ribosomal protein S18 acetylase RimI-like enzyme
MKVQFVPITRHEQIQTLALIADTVWHECYGTLLSGEQIDYMVRTFQSPAPIKKQIEEDGYAYFFLQVNGTNVGYIGIQAQPEEKTLFLSKLYILKTFRGNGYAGEVFEFLTGLCQGMGLQSIWLTVNKGNANSIAIYERKGFQTIRTQVADIGHGFVMDDYVMRLTIA